MPDVSNRSRSAGHFAAQSVLLVACLLGLLWVWGSTWQLAGGTSPSVATTVDFVPGQLLVRLKGNAFTDRAETFFVTRGYPVLNRIPAIGVWLIAVPAGHELATAAALQADDRVAYAEPNYWRSLRPAGQMATGETPPAPFHRPNRTPNDPYYNTPNYQWGLARIEAPQAWDVSTGTTQTVVAVLDTGVDSAHPELASKLVPGYDFVNTDHDASDDNGHGSHVAGIIGAVTNNGRGIAGLSWLTRIMPVKVLDRNGQGTVYTVTQGIRWAVQNGARIIHLSLASTIPSQSEQEAIDYAYSQGAVIVAPAGNLYQEGNPVIYPAAYPHVIGVGATSISDQRSPFSETGPFVDLTAPGGGSEEYGNSDVRSFILSTYWSGQPPLPPWPAAGYQAFGGTAQAAAHVSGLSALIWAVNGALTSDQVQQKMQQSAVDLGAVGRDDAFGYGRINALAALQLAQPPATPTPTHTATSTPTPTLTPTATRTPTPTATPRAQLAVSTRQLTFFASNAGDPEPVTISIFNQGGGTLLWTASDSPSWLIALSASSGTASVLSPGTLTVAVYRGSLVYGIRTGKITVSSNTPGVIGSPQIINLRFVYLPSFPKLHLPLVLSEGWASRSWASATD